MSTFFVCAASCCALAWALYPFMSLALSYVPRFNLQLQRPVNTCIGMISLQIVVLVGFSIVVVFAWLVTQDEYLNNVLGISLCVLCISIIQVPNMKVCTIIFIGLFVYDIFWVFYSSYFFGENVMLSVATKQAANPVNYIAEKFNITGIAPVVRLPVKLMTRRAMLGLGDIFVPGLLMANAYMFGKRKRRTPHERNIYFIGATVGYTIGLIITMYIAFVWHVAQPALLYLVPATLLPLFAIAFYRKDFHDLWHGIAVPTPSAVDLDA
eukprot:TRINITY_DN2223_c0_g1_i5.p1 TRINITY_DN2223_c0_g1~~TRINITY_DN2223_c0_g1_i5.p1  ORF type:complete len:267 (+),score=28.05 TRINITY_DN2223_c0_g1_i5:315-1115(+)